MQSKRRPQQSGSRRNQGPRQPAARPASPSVIQPLSSTPFKVIDQGRPRGNSNRNNRNQSSNRNNNSRSNNRNNAGNSRPNQFVAAPAQRTASAVNLITTPPRRPSQSSSRAPSVNVDNDGRNIGRCPGDSLENCIDVCPSFSARIFGACVAGCARRCPE